MANASNMTASHPYTGIMANRDIKAKAEINSYADAAAFLGKQDARTIAANTMLRRKWEGAQIHVVLYDTAIVTYYPDETFTVTNGGFRTPTTASRISQFTPDGYYASHANKVLHLNGEPADGRTYPTQRENA